MKYSGASLIRERLTVGAAAPAAMAICFAGFAAAQVTQSTTGAAASSEATAAAPPAAAPAAGLDEIVVTAQKRSENIQNVPISISAFSGQALQDSNIGAISDLERMVPTFRAGAGPGTAAARFDIRGLGSFGNSAIEPSVATFVDGVYVPRAASLVANLLDVQSIEVLSGPQGTLFGRNASIGAITVNTNLPTDQYEGSVAGEVGNGDRYRGEVILNAPVSEKVSLRFAGLVEGFKGYWVDQPSDERFGGLNTYSGRLTAKIDLAPNATWILRGDYLEQIGNGWPNITIVPGSLTPGLLANFSRILGGRLPPIGWSTNNNDDNLLSHEDDDHWGIGSTFTWGLPRDFSLRFIDSYRDWHAKEQDGELSESPVPLVYRNYAYRSRSQNHEIQFISPKDLLNGKFDFVSGLYFFREALDIDYYYNLRPEFCSTVIANLAPPLVGPCKAGPANAGFYNLYPQATDSYAVYGQGTYELLPQLKLTLGERYTWDEKHAQYYALRSNPAAVFGVNETTDLKDSYSHFTNRVNLAYSPLDDLMFFATYSTGFKSGGFNSGNATVVLGQQRQFAPEVTTNYEIGAKSQFFNHALTADVTIYRDDVDGFQERAQNGLVSTIRNVGAIRNQGVELTVSALPVSWLRLNTSLAYLDSRFTSYPNAPNVGYLTGVQNLTGTTPTYAPRWSTSEGAEYMRDLPNGFRLTLRADENTVSKANLNAVNDNNPTTFQNAYHLLSGRLSIYGPQERWNVQLFGTNLTDVHYCANDGYQVLGGQLGGIAPGQSEIIRCFQGNPRTFGLRASTKF